MRCPFPFYISSRRTRFGVLRPFGGLGDGDLYCCLRAGRDYSDGGGHVGYRDAVCFLYDGVGRWDVASMR